MMPLTSYHDLRARSIFPRSALSLFLGWLLLNHASVLVQSIPFQLVINNQRTPTECLYEHLDEGEAATLSVIILAGPELVSAVQIDGPVATSEIQSGLELAHGQEHFDQGRRYEGHGEYVQFHEDIDFEHLNLGEPDLSDLDEEQQQEGGEHETPQEKSARARRKSLERRQRFDQHKIDQRNYIREEGEPYQKTIRAPKAGWYRFCVWGRMLTVEVDLRKEKEMGGLDEFGHVLTVDQRELQEEDKWLQQDTAAQEGIKDEDFELTRNKLRELRRLLAEIQAKQSHERHRLQIHAATNEHSHSRMVLSSLLETILFMLVTGFQVYTIRRWFKGTPVLGR